ncbi:MAG: bifunctional phosphoglucose/phosphomannose isomerase [Armatimonadetes bacterium JP3_11]|nr:MAG: bifunctional phosphoglucose/phosphomannose isomerase [Armatimonadetes bacterium JP3_11]RMH09659.1 MAG: bifunctional phosphoglucose/phosphomannose isomerase [Armatimonadota bacterium]
MHPLDEHGLLAQRDPHGMMTLTLDFPNQCERAMQIASEASLPSLPRAPRQVIVCGMGGSAIGGDYLRALFEEYGDLPVQVIRDYQLPHSVDAQTLVFAVSYSGNTEETLACYHQAHERGAIIFTISSGGELQQRALADGVPHMQVPGGQPPRTALGYLFIPLMRLAERLGLLPDLSQPYTQMLTRLVQTRAALQPDVPFEQNPAKQLAQALHGRIPLIYGSGGARATVALRWKGQINENAKQHAFAYTFPELNHNEILGWVKASEQANNWSVVVLRDPDESAKIRTRIEVTRRLVGERADWHELTAEGASQLERLMHLTYFGDFVSLYLAFLNQVDPENIDYINILKAELAKIH